MGRFIIPTLEEAKAYFAEHRGDTQAFVNTPDGTQEVKNFEEAEAFFKPTEEQKEALAKLKPTEDDGSDKLWEDSLPDEIGILVGKDGDKFFARRCGFTNLQESFAGFGDTRASAVADLKKNELETSAVAPSNTSEEQANVPDVSKSVSTDGSAIESGTDSVPQGSTGVAETAPTPNLGSSEEQNLDEPAPTAHDAIVHNS